MRSRTNPLIYVRNRSRGFLKDEQVAECVRAIQRQVTEDFKPVWGVGARLVFARGSVPSHAYQIIVHRTAREEDAGYLGYHFSPEGYPVASIFAEDDLAEDKTISVTLSHEVLEMLIDPSCNLYAYRPSSVGRPQRIYFYEVCDAVQCKHYEIDRVAVCDFVHPEWFQDNWKDKRRRFDHLGLIRQPFEVLPGCYADVYESKRGSFTVWGSNELKSRVRHRFQLRKERMKF